MTEKLYAKRCCRCGLWEGRSSYGSCVGGVLHRWDFEEVPPPAECDHPSKCGECVSLHSLVDQAIRIRSETIETCARLAEAMIVGGRAWTEEQAEAAKTLGHLADNIRALAKGTP